MTFTPLVYGSQPAVLQIQGCKLCAPLSVPLDGIGFTPGLVFVPPTLTFNAIRGQIQTECVDLVILGNASGMIVGMGVPSDGSLREAGPFSAQLLQPLPTHLLTGQSFSFNVITYAPRASPRSRARSIKPSWSPRPRAPTWSRPRDRSPGA